MENTERPTFDIETACRVCLSNSDSASNIFATTCSNGVTLADAIMEHAPVQITPEDGSPCLICSTCYEDLEVSIRFRDRCIETDRLLKHVPAATDDDDGVDSDIESILRNVKVEIHDEGVSPHDDDAASAHAEPEDAADETVLPYSLTESFIEWSNRHRDDRPFECDMCGKRFRRKHHLNNHLTVHTGAKPFSCRICNGRFTRRESYLRHSKIHSGDYPYACRGCGKRFIQRSRLLKHAKIHDSAPADDSRTDADEAGRPNE